MNSFGRNFSIPCLFSKKEIDKFIKQHSEDCQLQNASTEDNIHMTTSVASNCSLSSAAPTNSRVLSLDSGEIVKDTRFQEQLSQIALCDPRSLADKNNGQIIKTTFVRTHRSLSAENETELIIDNTKNIVTPVRIKRTLKNDGTFDYRIFKKRKSQHLYSTCNGTADSPIIIDLNFGNRPEEVVYDESGTAVSLEWMDDALSLSAMSFLDTKTVMVIDDPDDSNMLNNRCSSPLANIKCARKRQVSSKSSLLDNTSFFTQPNNHYHTNGLSPLERNGQPPLVTSQPKLSNQFDHHVSHGNSDSEHNNQLVEGSINLVSIIEESDDEPLIKCESPLRQDKVMDSIPKPLQGSNSMDTIKQSRYRAILKEWQCCLNKKKGDKNAMVYVENTVDQTLPPLEFNYISQSIYSEGVPLPDPTALFGCCCAVCTERSSCCAFMAGHRFAYYKNGKLRVGFRTPIYECNSMCKCGEDCPSRVVQKGSQFPLCIFRTAVGRGWGVKTCCPIEKGKFVIEYVGELITFEEAERRGRQCDKEGTTYLFDLDFNDSAEFTIDAAKNGNVSHFLNHSCDPNLRVFSVWIDTLDLRLPRLALFARRDIAKDEELTFDYQMNHNMESVDADKRTPCLCGTKHCRGFLF